jgi:protein SCO1/2
MWKWYAVSNDTTSTVQRLLCIAAVFVVGSIATRQCSAQESAARREASSENAAPDFAPYPAPDFALTDQDRQTVTLSSLRGKIVLLDFIFTRCPGPCPLLSLKFSQLQKQLGARLGKEVMLVSITIDPRHDTPEVLKEYARRYEANTAGWKFLTGSTRDIMMTAAAFGADYQAGADGVIEHRLLTCVIDRDGTVVKEFSGANHTVDDLLAAVR